MKCPHCKNEFKGRVLETRPCDDDILRRRQCGHCGSTFVTKESVSPGLKIPKNRAEGPKSEKSEKVKFTSLDALKAWR